MHRDPTVLDHHISLQADSPLPNASPVSMQASLADGIKIQGSLMNDASSISFGSASIYRLGASVRVTSAKPNLDFAVRLTRSV